MQSQILNEHRHAHLSAVGIDTLEKLPLQFERFVIVAMVL